MKNTEKMSPKDTEYWLNIHVYKAVRDQKRETTGTNMMVITHNFPGSPSSPKPNQIFNLKPF